MRKSNWYEFRNQTEAMADLYLYGEVGGFGTNASEFISALSQIKGTHINLHIHSLEVRYLRVTQSSTRCAIILPV